MRNRNRYATQGACIVARLLKRPHTYGQMLALGVSTCPHKRVAEYLRGHAGLALVKATGRDGLIRWSIRRVRACTD